MPREAWVSLLSEKIWSKKLKYKPPAQGGAKSQYSKLFDCLRFVRPRYVKMKEL